MSAGGVGLNSPDATGTGTTAIRVGFVVLVLVAVVVMVVNQSTPGRRAFDLDSTAVDGYSAVRTLLEERGVHSVQVSAEDPLIDRLGARSVLFVPAPELASEEQVAGFVKVAERGATVVFGSPPRVDDRYSDEFGPGTSAPSRRALADTPIARQEQGICDIDEFQGLGAIDTAFGMGSLSADALAFLDPDRRVGEQRTCYGTPDAASFRSVTVADQSSDSRGRVVVMSSPYLWVNSRLQPAKEAGGPVPDNAATAVRLLHRDAGGAPATVTVVRAVRTSSSIAGGSSHPVELLPFGVKLALLQLMVAFLIFLWWRSRRLGPALVEPLPVEIAGSELISAIGRLRYRRNDTDRAARVLRSNMRRALGRSFGLPPTAHFEVLVETVAHRSGRSAEEVRSLLADGPVADREALVRLSNDLDSLHMETQDVH